MASASGYWHLPAPGGPPARVRLRARVLVRACRDVLLAAGAMLAVSSGIAASAAPAPAAAPTATVGQDNSQLAVPASGTLFGAFPDPWPGDQSPATMTSLEAAAGRKLDLDRIFSGWNVDEPDPQSSWDVANGIVPLVSIDAVESSGQPVRWSQIAAGSYDSTIVAQAKGLASLHGPVLLSFNHEAERFTANGTAADFVAAWRHYVTLVRRIAPNVSFVFILGASKYGLSTIGQWYPGNAYVDWMGADGYNYFGCNGQNPVWSHFSTIFSAFMSFAVANDKPAVVAEWGSAEDAAVPGRKAAWIAAAGQVMKTWPDIKAASYFDAHGPLAACDFPLNSSVSAMEAFAELGADPWFNPRPDVALAAVPAGTGTTDRCLRHRGHRKDDEPDGFMAAGLRRRSDCLWVGSTPRDRRSHLRRR